MSYPGGRCETSDGGLLHMVAREVLEETGIHLFIVLSYAGINYWEK